MKINRSYFPNKKIKEYWEVNKDGKRHGKTILYHENGQLRVELIHTDGKQNNGEIISFHDNGSKARCVNLFNGQFQGDFQEWLEPMKVEHSLFRGYSSCLLGPFH